VNAWTVVGLKNRVVKDIRKMIGKMIWEAREQAVRTSCLSQSNAVASLKER
jgi:hypothetical protein